MQHLSLTNKTQAEILFSVKHITQTDLMTQTWFNPRQLCLMRFYKNCLFAAAACLTWGSWCGRWRRSTPHTRPGSSAPRPLAGWRRSRWCCVCRCRSGRGGRWVWPVFLSTPQRTGSHWGPGRWRGTPRRACACGPSLFPRHPLSRWAQTTAQTRVAPGRQSSRGKPSAWCCPWPVPTCLMRGRKRLVVKKTLIS